MLFSWLAGCLAWLLPLDTPPFQGGTPGRLLIYSDKIVMKLISKKKEPVPSDFAEGKNVSRVKQQLSLHRVAERIEVTYTVYILLCADGTYYTGLTRYLQQRLDEHERGRSRYTQSRLPVMLAYEEEFASETEAVNREKQIKNWSHDKKKNLAEGKFHETQFLAKKKFR